MANSGLLERTTPEAQGIPSSAILDFIEALERDREDQAQPQEREAL